MATRKNTSSSNSSLKTTTFSKSTSKKTSSKSKRNLNPKITKRTATSSNDKITNSKTSRKIIDTKPSQLVDSNKTSESKDKKKNVKGIGGWLIIPTIGLFLGAFVWVALFLLYGIIILLGESDLLAISYFLVSLIMSFLTIYSLVLEFGRKKEFPKWITITYISGFLATIILSLVDGDFSDVYGSTLGTIIWVWYFYVSVRVKNTFVN